jgi:fatty acid desaturase
VTRADTPSDDSPNDLYRAVIGESNQEFYLSYFRRADSRGYAPISWHWPVLFIGLFWLLYRKQYRFALIVFVLAGLATTVATLIDSAFPSSGWPLPVISILGFAFVYVWLPLHANGIYYRWARSAVERAKVEFPGQTDAQTRYLEARGGVNAQLPYLVLIGYIVMSMLAGSLSQLGQ